MSIIEYHSIQLAHHCGYCNQYGSISHGLVSQQMEILDYQDMVDRGWRRAGTYFYKPENKEACCKLYTIRCDVAQVRLHRSHKRVIRTFNRWLAEGCPKSKVKRDSNQPRSSSKPEVSNDGKPKSKTQTPPGAAASVSAHPSSSGAKETSRTIQSKSWHKRWQNTLSRMRKQLANKYDARELEQAVLDKHKERLSARKAKWAKKCAPKSLEQRLEAMPVNSKYKLELRLVRTSPVSSEFKQSSTAEFALYKKYQVAIHHDDESEVSIPGFTRFLVHSPFQAALELTSDRAPGSMPCGFGSYHMQYWLVPRDVSASCGSSQTPNQPKPGASGSSEAPRLICVGVLDVLPHCVSSVYLFYDPDLGHVSLGTYSALREIALTRELTAKLSAQLKWYYLGFYIHTCPKMSYKGQYRPAYLLCPETYTWWPIEHCLPLLEASPYSRFAPALPNSASNAGTDSSAADGVPLMLIRRGKRRLLAEFVSECERDLEAKAVRLAEQARRREKKGKGSGSGSNSGASTGAAAPSSRARLNAMLFGGTASSAGGDDGMRLELARSRLHDLKETVCEYARLIGPACASRINYVLDDEEY